MRQRAPASRKVRSAGTSLPRVRHTNASIRASAERFLRLLDQHDVADSDGYFQNHPSEGYFAALHQDQPGAWSALVRNMAFGLDRFPQGPVLDIGCDHGLQSFVFAQHGHPVIGLDPAEHRIGVANKIAAAAGLPRLKFITGNARDALADLSGSSLWMHRSFHHIPEKSDFEHSALAFFQSAGRALTPGGVIVLMTSNSTSRALVPWAPRGQFSVPRLRRIIETARFEVLEVRYKGYLTSLPLRYRPSSAPVVDGWIARIPGVRRLGRSFAITARAL